MKFINFKLFIILFSFCFTESVKMVISDINVVGLERLSKEDIFRISKLYPESEIVRGDEINKEINRLWDIGRFSDIQIFADEQIDNKISINIKLVELPVLGNLEFIGNKRKRDRTLRDLVPKQLSEGQILSENKIFNAKNNIIDKYVEDSFHSISIDSTVIKDTDLNHVKDLVFYINEGKKSKIKNIIINGNNNFPFKRFFEKNQISKIFKNTKKFSLLFPWRGKYKKESFEEDLKILELFYHNNGYCKFEF